VRIGVTSALCHSTVDNSFAKGIGKRLDGWAKTDFFSSAMWTSKPGCWRAPATSSSPLTRSARTTARRWRRGWWWRYVAVSLASRTVQLADGCGVARPSALSESMLGSGTARRHGFRGSQARAVGWGFGSARTGCAHGRASSRHHHWRRRSRKRRRGNASSMRVRSFDHEDWRRTGPFIRSLRTF
jgi:hypothetical protein